MSAVRSDAAIVYEVRVVVAPEIAAEYRHWLEAHIREVVAIAGFRAVTLYREESSDQSPIYVMHYQLDDRQSLDNYFRDHAPRLRADGIARFGDKFSATRRILLLEQEFSL